MYCAGRAGSFAVRGAADSGQRVDAGAQTQDPAGGAPEGGDEEHRSLQALDVQHANIRLS